MTTPLNQTVLRLAYATEDELDRKLILTLQRRGYVVTKARPEEITMKELASRVGRSPATISRALGRPARRSIGRRGSAARCGLCPTRGFWRFWRTRAPEVGPALRRGCTPPWRRWRNRFMKTRNPEPINPHA